MLEDGTTDFLEGQDMTTCGYYIGRPFLGNCFMDGSIVRKGSSPDLPAIRRESNFNAAVTEFNGFGFDASEMNNELTVITSIVQEYRPSLACGQYSEERYNEFVNKLKEAGTDEYLAPIQTQLDEWLAVR